MAHQPLSTRLDQLEADNARLRRLLDRRDVGAELRHQTRNTLSSVRALIRRSAETAQSVEDYAAHLEGRLDVILRVQAMVMHHRAGIDLYLLLAGELRVLAADEDRQVRPSGPRVALQPKAAQTLALAFHELATNAMKFGALAQAGGSIDVTWRVVAGEGGVPVLALTWQEGGVTIARAAPIRRGFGREVLDAMLCYELKAETTLDFAATGLRCDIRLPLRPEIGTPVDHDPAAD